MKHPDDEATIPLSIRVRPKVRDALEDLAYATGRSKSYLAAEALESYLETQSWQVNAIAKSLDKANSKDAKFYDDKIVTNWMKSWGTKDEKEPPK